MIYIYRAVYQINCQPNFFVIFVVFRAYLKKIFFLLNRIKIFVFCFALFPFAKEINKQRVSMYKNQKYLFRKDLLIGEGGDILNVQTDWYKPCVSSILKPTKKVLRNN